MKHIRMMIIALFAVGGAVVLAGEPIEQENWFNAKLWSFIIGFGMWGVAALLHKAWEGQGLLPKDDYNDSWDE